MRGLQRSSDKGTLNKTLISRHKCVSMNQVGGNDLVASKLGGMI